MNSEVIMDRIQKILDEDYPDFKMEALNEMSAISLMISITEEVGELCKEVQVQYGINRTTENRSRMLKAEAVDVIIATLALFQYTGGTNHEFIVMIQSAIKKWENNIKERSKDAE